MDIARTGHGTSHHHHAADKARQLGVAFEGAGDVCQRAEGEDRDRLGSGPDLIADDLFRRMRGAQLGDLKAGVSQAIDAMEMAAVDRQSVVGRRGGADAGQSRRIELLDDRLDVARGQLGRYVAAHGGDGHDLQARIEQGQANGDRVIDAGIAIENHFLGDQAVVLS